MNSIPNTPNKVFSRMSADLTKATPLQEKLTLDGIEPKALYRWGQIKDVLPSKAAYNNDLRLFCCPELLALPSSANHKRTGISFWCLYC